MKRFILPLLLASLCQLAGAAVLNPEEAYQRAMSTKAHQLPALVGQEKTSPQLLYTTYAGSLPATYVLSNGTGFVVVAADDAAEALLGYSEDGVFDPENIPDNMKYWLHEYDRQIEWGREHNASYVPQRLGEGKQPVKPICTTKWNQGAPFNGETPMIGSVRPITGCVATAMAQIMKAHNWPDKGVGRKSYFCNAIGSKISMVFENTTFDWDNMLDVYGSANDVQRLAVATLMKACGYSVEMDYTTGACGAQSYNVAVALWKYFKYRKDIKYVLRDFWGAREWEDMIYAEVAAGRPVYYSGANKDAGHAFVCDGYSKDGYFHINWGWGGQSDGYFLLNGLDPSSQGLGGSDAGYNSWQEVIINIQPNKEDESLSTYKWMGAYDFNFASNRVKLGESAEITSWFYNYTVAPLSGKFGLKLQPKTPDAEPIYLTEGTTFNNLTERSGKGGSVLLPADLAEGEYTVTVGITSDGEWHDCRTAIYTTQEYDLTVKNGVAEFKACEPATVRFQDINYTPLYLNTKFVVDANVVNPTAYDFYKGIYLEIVSGKGNAVMKSETLRFDLASGDSQNWSYTAKLEPLEGETIDCDKEYYMLFRDDQNIQLSDKVPVRINPEAKAEMKFGSLYMTDGKTTNVDPHNLSISIDVECLDGYFAESLFVWIFYYSKYGAEGSAVAGFPAGMAFLQKGDKATIEFKGDFNNAEDNKRYIAQVWYGSGWLPGSVIFRVGEVNGIDDAEYKQTVATEYYTLQGVKVNGALESGLFIKVDRMLDGTSTQEKIIIR